jgi:hypothetical protein
MDNLQAEIDKVNELENKYTDFHKKYLINGYYGDIAQRADQGCAGAQFIAFQMGSGKAYYKRYSDASNYCKESAAQGNALAQCFLGDYYFEQDTVKAVKEAFKWYMKSAKQGNVVAQIKVAECYYHGKGVEKDHHKAMEWMGRASKPKLDLPQNTLENHNATLIQENIDLIENVKVLLKDKKKLINDNTKLINDIESKKEQSKKEQPKKEQSKLKNWFKKLKGK